MATGNATESTGGDFGPPNPTKGGNVKNAADWRRTDCESTPEIDLPGLHAETGMWRTMEFNQSPGGRKAPTFLFPSPA